MKSLLGDFNAKVGREDIFKLTIENESLHEISNDNGVMGGKASMRCGMPSTTSTVRILS
jgi:hypothetical protein